jgi:hypothetical protein
MRGVLAPVVALMHLVRNNPANYLGWACASIGAALQGASVGALDARIGRCEQPGREGEKVTVAETIGRDGIWKAIIVRDRGWRKGEDWRRMEMEPNERTKETEQMTNAGRRKRRREKRIGILFVSARDLHNYSRDAAIGRVQTRPWATLVASASPIDVVT